MAQTYNQTQTSSTFANNLQLPVNGSNQTVLDAIPCFGGRNIAVSIVCSAGSISAVALFGSPDGINYVAIAGLSTFTVSAGNVGHSECVANWQYLRLQVNASSATCDFYLYAVQ